MITGKYCNKSVTSHQPTQLNVSSERVFKWWMTRPDHYYLATAIYQSFDVSATPTTFRPFSAVNVIKYTTRSSPQWWSGRSTTAHDVPNMGSPIYPSVWGTWGSGWANSVACRCIPISSPMIHMVYLLPFWCYLAGSNSVSVRPSVRIQWQIPL